MTWLARVRSESARLERALALSALAGMVVLPLAEILLRRTVRVGVPGSILIVQNLTLIVAFLGAALAARSDRLLALATTSFLPEAWRRRARQIANTVGVGIVLWLVKGGIDFVREERASRKVLFLDIPSWVVVSVIPVGLILIAYRLVMRASPGWKGRLGALAGGLLPAVFGGVPGGALLVPGVAMVILATACGLPIFAALGGLSLLLFHAHGVPAASIPAAAYSLTSFPVLPAVPLFTLTGFILASGKASDRVVRVFDALVGWMPGGAAVVTTLVFAFFTSFTGASGVTILSIGGLLLPVLVKSRFSESFSLGLVTVSGSIGLLLPPSIPVMLYGVYAQQPIDAMFLAGILPGILLVLLIVAWGVREGRRVAGTRRAFDFREARAAVRGALWELLLPVVMLVAIFGGFATMVEAAALTAMYGLVVQVIIRGDLSLRRDIPKIFVEAATLIGGFLVILGVALALTDYLNVAEIPTRALELVRAHIESKYMFLLVLNIFLLIVGALMDIYSAIFVVVPLIAPMAAAYGIHPIHLGIIFLANLELGYLTPPMGENLFLSASRFDKPVLTVFRCTIPFYVILFAGVILITYVPALTLTLVEMFGKG